MITIASTVAASPLIAPRHSIEAAYRDPKAAPFRYRARRFAHLQPVIEQIIADTGRCRIADIGGTEYYWDIFGSFVADNAVTIDLINRQAQPVRSANFRAIIADAASLGDMPDGSYDLVHSNSVIEHVGNWDRMARMAANARRLAPAYFIQTPNFWFPYEPHFRCPFFHWLPEQVRAGLLMRCNLGFGGRQKTLDEAMRGVQSASLLSARQMQELFPDGRIVRERAFGLTKSFMAIRQTA